MHDRQFSAGLIICCSGKQEAEVLESPFGELRSRSGAKLKYVLNDVRSFSSLGWFTGDLPEGAYITLENPTKKEVYSAIDQINKILSQYPQEHTGIDFYFAGHGTPFGELVLADEGISAKELIIKISETLKPGEGYRGFSFVLDSCYSGGFLIDTVVELENNSHNVRLYDAKVSSMHNEKSWEMSFLEAGVFTYSLVNQGNKYVEPKELSKAIEEQDQRLIAKYLQGMVGSIASSVAFLTKARQHSIDCLKGMYFEIDGLGGFELPQDEPITRDLLIKCFFDAKQGY